MRDIDLDTAFYEMYNLNSDEYEGVSITTLPFSVRIINRFMGNGITNVAELLKTTPSALMKIKGFGKNCLDEVDDLCSKLDATNTSSSTQGRKDFGTSSLFMNYRDEIAIGDFSVFDKLELSEEEAVQLQKYKEAYEVLGEELVFESVSSAEKIIPIVEMFVDYQNRIKKQVEIWKMANALPNARKSNKAFGYINAFTLDESKRALLKEMCESEDASLLSMAGTNKVDDAKAYILLKSFFKWCAFDLTKEIDDLFGALYENERIKTVIQLRSRKQTLEQVGNTLGVTRERVRQIEAKAKRLFSRLHSRIRIISKIAAERNGDTILTPAELEEYCGANTSDLLFFLQSYESSNYTYDHQLDIFIVGDDSISGRVQSSIESLPEIIRVNQLDSMLGEAAEEADVPVEMLEKAFLDDYRLTGEVYHRYRLSLVTIYERVLETHYPNGFKAYDTEEVQNFRKIIADEYGDVGLPTNDRALTSRVASICILCGKGLYRLKNKDYMPRQLANRICDYIENNENTIFLTNTLFSVFEKELLAAGIDNKYFLQGILHELFADKFIFRRDYISKDIDVTSVYSAVVDFIKKSNFPVSKAQIQEAFPGITEIVINLSVGDPTVLNYFGEYLHASKLNILDGEKLYLFNVINELLSDGEAHHGREMYEKVSREKPEILTRNAAMYPFSAFSIVEYLFRDKFQFSRPYMAKNGVEIGRPAERLHDLIYSNDEFTVNEISEFSRENHFQIYSLLEYVNSCNDEFLLIDNNTMMRIERIGISAETVSVIESIILSKLSGTMAIANLDCWSQFPAILVPWTDWLVYSAIKKWSNRLEVSTSYNQFRSAVPLVAPKGKMDESQFWGMDKETMLVQPIQIDNLDNIDDLIASYIDFEEETRGEDEF